jgi:hypothetical protein
MRCGVFCFGETFGIRIFAKVEDAASFIALPPFGHKEKRRRLD